MSRRLPSLLAAALLGAAAIVAAIAVAAGCGGGSGGGKSTAAADDALHPQDVHELYEHAAPSVFMVQARLPRAVSTGTGFLYDDKGHLVTNAHVVANSQAVALRLSRNKLLDAKVVGVDPSSDLAVLQVDAGALDAKPLTLGSTKDVQVGEPVVAIGNPFGLADTITAGIVSAVQREIAAPNGFPIDHVIQTDAAINPGNSGGPLLDEEGRVIGVNSQIATGGKTDANAGIGFAIPADTVAKIVPQLISTGHVAHPFLGVSTVAVTPRLADQLDLGVDHGALVVAVAPGSPADRAGLRSPPGNSPALIPGGDVIVSVGGKDVSGPDDLANAVAAHQPGDTVKLTYVRRGAKHSTSVRLAVRPAG